MFGFFGKKGKKVVGFGVSKTKDRFFESDYYSRKAFDADRRHMKRDRTDVYDIYADGTTSDGYSDTGKRRVQK